jgi:hypothetical protein
MFTEKHVMKIYITYGEELRKRSNYEENTKIMKVFLTDENLFDKSNDDYYYDL